MRSKHPASTGAPKSILIVDDDDMIVELLSLGFERHGFIVYKAVDGLEAWDLFNRERMDIVFTDLRIPGINGYELVRRIRLRSPATKIAMTTGGDASVVTQLLNDGVTDYFFPKPYNIKTICKIVAAEAQPLLSVST
ncbi:MAG: response regulator [Desulfobacterales bacterium]